MKNNLKIVFAAVVVAACVAACGKGEKSTATEGDTTKVEAPAAAPAETPADTTGTAADTVSHQ